MVLNIGRIILANLIKFFSSPKRFICGLSFKKRENKKSNLI
jgi:hypothetical protein